MSDWDGAVVVLLIHGSSDVLALNVGRCPHAAQGKEDGDEGLDEGAELRATDRVIVEDSEDYCWSRSGQHWIPPTSREVTRELTRNREGLATHDEDDLHGSELLEAHATS